MRKCQHQALGPSKSEPPCKTMPDGIGIVENEALFDPFMTKALNHHVMLLLLCTPCNAATKLASAHPQHSPARDSERGKNPRPSQRGEGQPGRRSQGVPEAQAERRQYAPEARPCAAGSPVSREPEHDKTLDCDLPSPFPPGTQAQPSPSTPNQPPLQLCTAAHRARPSRRRGTGGHTANNTRCGPQPKRTPPPPLAWPHPTGTPGLARDTKRARREPAPRTNTQRGQRPTQGHRRLPTGDHAVPPRHDGAAQPSAPPDGAHQCAA